MAQLPVHIGVDSPDELRQTFQAFRQSYLGHAHDAADITSGLLAVARGGTAIGSYAIGDLLYASGATTLAKLADVAAGNVLLAGGVGVAPAYGKVGLTTHISGTLAVGNGGTGLTGGTSGGVPYFSGTATLASSALLTASAILLGGGAGAAPSALGSLGTTTTVLHGNAAGAPTWGAVALGTDVSGTLPVANGGVGNHPADGRLTISSGVPVPMGDVTSGTLYYTPYVGNRISLYVSGAWVPHTFTQLSWTIDIDAAPWIRDVFVYSDGGAATLEVLPWTGSPEGRATALAYQDGVLVKNGDPTWRYVGTVRASAVDTVDDSAANRYVWNYYHRVARRLGRTGSASHNYNTASWRAWNNNLNTAVAEFVVGYLEEPIEAQLNGDFIAAVAGEAPALGIGLNVSSATSFGQITNPYTSTFWSTTAGTAYPALGYNYIAAIEYGQASNPGFSSFSLTGVVWA